MRRRAKAKQWSVPAAGIARRGPHVGATLPPPSTPRKDHHRERDVQINVRCTLEERTRILAGATKAYEAKPSTSEWGWRVPFSFARWARDVLLAAADSALGPKKPATGIAKKKTRKVRR